MINNNFEIMERKKYRISEWFLGKNNNNNKAWLKADPETKKIKYVFRGIKEGED